MTVNRGPRKLQPAFGAVSDGLGFAGKTLSEIGAHGVAKLIIANGAVGGLFRVAQGGSFASGFVSAGLGALGGPAFGDDFAGGLAFSAILGGTAATLAGGKFANGAITGAFAYLASSAARGGSSPSQDEGGYSAEGAYSFGYVDSNGVETTGVNLNGSGGIDFVQFQFFARPPLRWQPPTNPPQAPPTQIPNGWRIREMPPDSLYPDGRWILEKPMPQGGWQRIDPSTMKPGGHPETHVPFPPGQAPTAPRFRYGMQPLDLGGASCALNPMCI